MQQMPTYKERVSLIPGGCPQFLDFQYDLGNIGRLRRHFYEVMEQAADGASQARLCPLVETDDGDLLDAITGKPVSADSYVIDGRKSLEPWLEQWIPVPFLRERDQVWENDEETRVERGPSNWARVRLCVLPDAPEMLRVVLAFDMQIEEPVAGTDIYAALSADDVSSHAQFRLASKARDNAWFVNEAWVDSWLGELWGAHRRTAGRRRDDDEPKLEYIASYLTMLEVLHASINHTKVYVINPETHSPIDVDLVLDLGNARSTGILVETRAQSVTNLNDSYLLQLRDMDKPENIYTDPFETRVEFSEAMFGNDALSRRSGRRTTAFAWPSPVRIGPEAARLSTLSVCAEGATGMSSPKRYLWDERDWQQSWRFNTRGAGEPYVTRGPLAQNVNASGTPLCCMDDKRFLKNTILRKQERECAFESFFTRSSLMMFLLVEVLQQALVTINAPGQRCRREVSDVPRRLRQVIFTVPAGMPIAEQRIYRRWAHWAVRVLWTSLGWSAHYTDPSKPVRAARADYRSSPQVRCNWDEATCTQLVYIYNEITQKFQGDAERLFALVGRPQAAYGNSPCLRVATVDIGGGTTDLSITTFELTSDAGSSARIAPHIEFRDGFNLAGDDVLRSVVEEHVLPAIGTAMEAAGVVDARRLLVQLFGRDMMDSSQESRNRRAQFVRQVAVPTALCVLQAYEKADLKTGRGEVTCTFRDIFCEAHQAEASSAFAHNAVFEQRPHPHKAAVRYVEDAVRKHTGKDFSLFDVELRINPREVDATVRAALKEVLANLCEVIHLYNCDVLLLTGRPSQWQGIVASVFAHLPVPPDRIRPMGEYHAGAWYPFADAMGRITDPKTTVVVGAILCSLAEGHLEGFSFDPSNLALRSTARYIGEMELTGKIKASKVWFTVDVDSKDAQEYKHVVTFSAPIAVGFRQLDAERWTTTRFYYLDFVNEDARRKSADKLPFAVTLGLRVGEISDDAPGGLENTERDEGEFVIQDAVDRDGGSVLRDIEIRLQTLPRGEGFWLDTGQVLA